MNTFNINIEKCQKQAISSSERLANIKGELYHLEYFSSRLTDKKVQEDYELCCQRKEWCEEDLKKAREALDKAQKLRDENYEVYGSLRGWKNSC